MAKKKDTAASPKTKKPRSPKGKKKEEKVKKAAEEIEAEENLNEEVESADSDPKEKTEKTEETTGKGKRKTKPDAKEEKSGKPEFIAVWINNERDEFPVKAIQSGAVEYNFRDTDPNRPKCFAIIQKTGDKTVYYVDPKDFEEYIRLYGVPENLAETNKQAEEDLQELKRAWVRFGTSALKVNAYRTYLTEYETFEEYCEKKLKLNRGTVYEIMRSTLFLIKHQPKLYDSLMEGKVKNAPTYRSLYILDKKQKLLEKKGKFQELLDQVLRGELSTRKLQEQLREILQEEKGAGADLAAVIKKYEKICEEIEGVVPDEHQNIITQVQDLLKQLKDLAEE